MVNEFDKTNYSVGGNFSIFLRVEDFKFLLKCLELSLRFWEYEKRGAIQRT